MSQTLFTSSYMGPISYYAALLKADSVLLEQFNHYERKTFQNRCVIMSANGPIALSIPIERGTSPKILMKDVKVANHTPWQKQHFRALMSAYRNSPFYEYYVDDFTPLYEKSYKYLLDFNMDLQSVVLEQLELELDLKLTDSYQDGIGTLDIRYAFHPRKSLNLPFEPYVQVFSDKEVFAPDLSIIDLLFNLGSEAEDYLIQLGK